MILSVIITGISGLILSLRNIILVYPDIYEYLESMDIYGTNVSFTIAETSIGPPFVLHLWMIILAGLICFLMLTIVFYFTLNYLKKRKK